MKSCFNIDCIFYVTFVFLSFAIVYFMSMMFQLMILSYNLMLFTALPKAETPNDFALKKKGMKPVKNVLFVALYI